MDRNKKYNIGLDIGTNSVGWAVTDTVSNKVLKIGKKKLWGVRLFEEGQSASTRRIFRGTRRRLDRRRQRIKYLQEIFEEEIYKTDPTFFVRLKDGFLHKSDKTINKDIKDTTKQFKNNLFIDKDFNDSDFYKKYPTIYHLRYDLMKNKTNDIRLIYLAMHHIIKYRGNFIQEGKKIDVTRINIDKDLENTFNIIKENYTDVIETTNSVPNYKNIKEILINKSLKKSEKQTLVAKELKEFIPNNKISKSIAGLISGCKVNLLDIFLYELEDPDQINKCKISFEGTDFDDNLSELEEIFGDNIELINEFNTLYNSIYLNNLFKNIETPTISCLMIKKYNKHQTDKKLLKEYLTNEDKKKFFSKEGVYQKYVKSIAELKKIAKNKTPYEYLANELKKILNHYEDSKIKEQILNDIDNNDFLPKITDTSNGKFPYQLNENELNKIIDVQKENFPFLGEKLEDNTYKITKLLTFRIPYYVGPLNLNAKKDDPEHKSRSNAWLVKNSNEKITPYNFDKVVDKIESANNFIVRMTSKCTYLYDEEAMPANSLLYSKFKVLNEIKQIRINNYKIDKELEQQMIKELFLKYPKVTDKRFKNWLIEIKYLNADSIENITGYSNELAFANNLKPYIDFIKIFNYDYVLKNEEIIENLIEWITIFEDKKILKEKIKKEYPEFDNETLNKICNLKYKGWSALSRKLLTGIYYKDKVNKNQSNIIELMENTEENFMQILFNKNYKFQEKIDQINLLQSKNDITIDDIQNLVTSPANKRAIWQTIKIIKEIVSIIGYNPEHIYIEMAKQSGEKKRTDPRHKQLLNLYKKCKEDIDNYNELYNELSSIDKIDSDKYFLYFLQQGKSLYSGESISLQDLNSCEIDHIIPRTLIKDDSLDNRALVKRDENQIKGSNNVIPYTYREKAIGFWKQLKDNNFISEKKYRNLVRTEFKEKDIEGFINRQLVETRQITKHIASLLNNLYDPNKNVSSENTVVQFINANISHNYREKYELYKYRQLNDYHHAHDAYLAAVLGNYKTILFKNKNKKEFIFDYKQSLTTKDNEDKCYGIIIDSIEENIAKDNGEIVFDANEFKNTVYNTLYNQDILISRKTEIYTGEFYNQTIYKKGEGKIPLKQGLDPNKYGGYNSINCAYTTLIKYNEKEKEIYKLIGIPIMYIVNKNKKELIDNYIKESIKNNDYIIIKDKIPFKSLIKFKGQLCYIVGSNEVCNGVELQLSKEKQIEYKYLLNFICNNKYPNYKVLEDGIIKKYNLNINYNNKQYWNNVFNEQINEFFKYLLNLVKEKYPLFKGEIEKLSLVEESHEFANLPLIDNDNISKKEVIIQMLKMFKANSENANLEKLNKTCKFSNRVGRKNGNNINSFILYNKSVTGLKEDELDYEF